MNTTIFSNAALLVALCALTPACVAPSDPETAGDLKEMEEDDGAQAEGEEAEASDEAALPEEERAAVDEKGSGGTFDLVTPYTWTSVYTGGYGGSPVWLSCAEGEVATGIHGRSGAVIDQLGLVCTQIHADNSFGQVTFRGATGGSGGSAFVSTCPTNHAIRGIEGRSANLIDQIRIKCDTIPGTWILYTGPSFGGSGGSSFGYTAPSRYFLTALDARAGDMIDGFRSRFNYVAP